MRKIFLLLIVIAGKLYSQNYSIINGDTINLCKGFWSSDVFAQDSSGFYILESYVG